MVIKGDEIVEKAVGRPNIYLLKKSDYWILFMQLIPLEKIRQKPGRSEFRTAEKKGDEIL